MSGGGHYQAMIESLLGRHFAQRSRPARPPVNAAALRVFLCHSSGDKARAADLYHRLKTDGFSAWLDKEDILSGQNWDYEIRDAVGRSHVVVICLSASSVTKEGYVQKEIAFAIDRAIEKPEGVIYIIPVRLEECAVPKRLQPWRWVDLFDPDGYRKLISALKTRAEQLGV